MNSLTILVLIVVGVVGAYLLEEWFEKSNTKIFTKSNVIGYGPWEGGHLFSPFPEGWFTDSRVIREHKHAIGIMVIASLLVNLSLLWFLINVASLFRMATAYSILFLIAFTIGLVEFTRPVKSWVTAMPRTVGIYGKKGDLAIGVIGGLAFVLLSNLLSFTGFETWSIEPLTKGPSLVMEVWLVGICIPVTEEYFFNKFTATGIENWGVVPGILGFSVLSWLFFHWSVYGLVGLMPVVLVLFGLFRGFSLLTTKGAAAPVVAHIIVNLGALAVALS